MKKPQLNNKGFGLVGILILVVVLAAAGGAGVYVWHKNHKAKTTVSTAPNTNTSTGNNSKSTQQGYLTIKEWGVRIKPATTLPDVTYTIDNSDGHHWAVLTFKKLPETCAGVYHFSRATAGQDIDGYGTTPEKFLSIDSSSVKKVGDYYYYLGHGQAACTPQSATTEQNTLVQQITGQGTNGSNVYNYTVEAIPGN